MTMPDAHSSTSQVRAADALTEALQRIAALEHRLAAAEALLDELRVRTTPLSMLRAQGHAVDLQASPPSGSPSEAQGDGGMEKANDTSATEEKGQREVHLLFTSGLANPFAEAGDRRFWAVEFKAGGLTADSSQEAEATAQQIRVEEVDSSGLTAEGKGTVATSTTAGERLDSAMAPEPAEG